MLDGGIDGGVGKVQERLAAGQAQLLGVVSAVVLTRLGTHSSHLMHTTCRVQQPMVS
jgi:hypothetical protein